MDTRIIALIAGSCFLFSTVKAQELACGTNPSEKDIRELRSLKTHAILGDQVASEPIYIAITAHIVRNSDGTGGLTEQELADAIEDVNSIYTLTNMTFFLFGDINYIDDDSYFNFNSEDESALTSANNVENTINVYFFDSAMSGETAVCGYAYFPSSQRDHIIMVNSCTTNGSTFPHELGHYFSLYHTHGKTNAGTTDELVDGSNCTSAGDDICDTAADPNLSGKVSGSCVYTGTDTDGNGDEYVPNPRNLMSYSRKQCRDEFSQGQADRIASAYQTYKTYLISKEYAAAFDVDDKAVCQGETVSYTSKSVGAASYAWTFEGGTPSTSTAENPVVTYNTIGTYDVSLVITEAGGDMDTKAFADYISVKGSVSSNSTEGSGSFEEAQLDEEVINDDGRITFSQTSAASTEGSQSVYMDFLSYSQEGELDYLIFSTLNTSSVKSFAITFDYAYAPYNESFFDGLAVVYRDPCEDWVTVWEKTGTDLQTNVAQTSAFIPNSTDWKSETISIAIPGEIDVIEIAFKAINGYGNNLYIDNYDVKSTTDFSVDEIQVTDATCFDAEDGSITVVASSPGSLSYSKDDGSFSSGNVFTNLARGDYSIAVKNEEGVTLTNTVTVGSPDEILIEFDVAKPSCPDSENGMLAITGLGDGYEFSIGGGEFTSISTFDNLGEGTYEFNVIDGNGCEKMAEVILVAENDYPNQPVIIKTTEGLSVIVEENQGVQWYLDGSLLAGASESVLNSSGRGSYTVEVSNGDCLSLSEPFVILSSPELQAAVELYPNPAINQLNIKLPNTLEKRIESITIRDFTGRIIKVHSNAEFVDVSTLNSGMYLLELSGSGIVVSKRFLKR